MLFSCDSRPLSHAPYGCGPTSVPATLSTMIDTAALVVRPRVPAASGRGCNEGIRACHPRVRTQLQRRRGLRQNGPVRGEKAKTYVDISRLLDEAMGHFDQIPSDVQMASISGRKPLGRAASPPGASFGPICSPFGRLDGAVMEPGPWRWRRGPISAGRSKGRGRGGPRLRIRRGFRRCGPSR